jgi:SAM-dependent methyltransferase
VLSTGRWALKRPVAELLRRLGILGPAFRAYESLLARDWRASLFGRRQEIGPDGLPVPSKELRVRAGPATADVSFFLRTGSADAAVIVDALERDGARIASFGAVLDFGCGCGRVIRHWHDLQGPVIHGCDVSEDQIDWCRRNLAFARFARNNLEPPLEYPDETFDLVYAFSVFTHLPEDLQLAWMDELYRITQAGGYVVVSTHGEPFLVRLSKSQREQFESGRQVVFYEEWAGTGLCSTYTPPSYVKDVLGRRFRYASFLPAVASGQDAHLLRKES